MCARECKVLLAFTTPYELSWGSTDCRELAEKLPQCLVHKHQLRVITILVNTAANSNAGAIRVHINTVEKAAVIVTVRHQQLPTVADLHNSSIVATAAHNDNVVASRPELNAQGAGQQLRRLGIHPQTRIKSKSGHIKKSDG